MNNNGKEIARVTLGSQSPDTAAALETCARLGVRVEACLTAGSALVVFKPLRDDTLILGPSEIGP